MHPCAFQLYSTPSPPSIQPQPKSTLLHMVIVQCTNCTCSPLVGTAAWARLSKLYCSGAILGSRRIFSTGYMLPLRAKNSSKDCVLGSGAALKRIQKFLMAQMQEVTFLKWSMWSPYSLWGERADSCLSPEFSAWACTWPSCINIKIHIATTNKTTTFILIKKIKDTTFSPLLLTINDKVF